MENINIGQLVLSDILFHPCFNKDFIRFLCLYFVISISVLNNLLVIIEPRIIYLLLLNFTALFFKFRKLLLRMSNFYFYSLDWSFWDFINHLIFLLIFLIIIIGCLGIMSQLFSVASFTIPTILFLTIAISATFTAFNFNFLNHRFNNRRFYLLVILTLGFDGNSFRNGRGFHIIYIR